MHLSSESHTVSGSERRATVSAEKSPELPNNHISTRGKPVLTSMMGTESKIIKELKTVYARQQNSWDTMSVLWE